MVHGVSHDTLPKEGWLWKCASAYQQRTMHRAGSGCALVALTALSCVELRRRGQTNTAWKKRWFVLTPAGYAFYYKSPPSSVDSSPQGVLGLSGAQMHRPRARKGAHGRMPLDVQVTEDGRIYHIEVEAHQLDEWCAAFTRAAATTTASRHTGWEADDEVRARAPNDARRTMRAPLASACTHEGRSAAAAAARPRRTLLCALGDCWC